MDSPFAPLIVRVLRGAKSTWKQRKEKVINAQEIFKINITGRTYGLERIKMTIGRKITINIKVAFERRCVDCLRTKDRSVITRERNTCSLSQSRTWSFHVLFLYSRQFLNRMQEADLDARGCHLEDVAMKSCVSRGLLHSFIWFSFLFRDNNRFECNQCIDETAEADNDQFSRPKIITPAVLLSTYSSMKSTIITYICYSFIFQLVEFYSNDSLRGKCSLGYFETREI